MFDFSGLFSGFMKSMNTGSVGTIVKLGSVLFDSLGKQADYSGEISAANYNSGIDRQSIAINEQQTQQELDQQRRQNYLRAGAGRAAAAANGLGMTGSAADILADNAAQDALSLLNIKYTGDLKRIGYTNNIGLNNTRVAGLKKSARISRGASLLNGFSTFAGTVLK